MKKPGGVETTFSLLPYHKTWIRLAYFLILPKIVQFGVEAKFLTKL
jgi:hypothetical protein